MGTGTALLLWLALAAVTGALFSFVPRGSTERWLLGAGLLLAAAFLVVAVALPAPTSPSVAATASVAGMLPASTATPEAPPSTAVPTLAPTALPTALSTTAIPTIPPVAATAAPTAPADTTADALASTAAPEVVTVLAGIVNVRSAPTFGDNVIGQVVGGDELVVLDTAEGWLLVRLGTAVSPVSSIANGEGWVSGELVTGF